MPLVLFWPICPYPLRSLCASSRGSMVMKALLHHGRAPMDAPLAPSSRMHGAAVVPYDDVARLPFLPVLGVGLQHVPVQLGKQPIAFRFLHVDNADDVRRVHVERLAPGLGVDTHHVVDSGWGLLIFEIEPLYAFALAAAIPELDLQGSDP